MPKSKITKKSPIYKKFASIYLCKKPKKSPKIKILELEMFSLNRKTRKTRKKRKTKASKPGKPGQIPKIGLKVHKKFIDSIFKNKRIWKIGNSPVKKRLKEYVYIVYKNKIYGVIQITDSVRTTKKHLIKHKDKYSCTLNQINKLSDSKLYCWKIKLIKKFRKTYPVSTQNTNSKFIKIKMEERV